MSPTGKGFRYPAYSDTPDVPRDLEYLAEDVDAYLDAHPGPQGIQGTTGIQGLTGPQGIQGSTGAQGTTGLQGIQGAQGTTGSQGSTGAQGTTGLQGTTGAQGTTGSQGTTGTQGATGTQGSTGIQGTTGSQGIQGIQGTQGLQGIQGIQGTFGPATVTQNSQTSSYTVTSSDNGKYIDITTGGVTLATTTGFTAGQNVVVYNNSSSNQTITQGSSTTLRWAGTASTGDRTLSQYGIATILCVASNTYVIAGTGIT